MTITLTAPNTPTQTPTARCACGGYLVTLLLANLRKTGQRQRPTLHHIDVCADCAAGDPATCDLREVTHKTCATPDPIGCGHTGCHADAHPAGDITCGNYLDCCGCCLS